MYKAIIILNNAPWSSVFPTIHDAEHWLDSQNNNNEHTTIIQELDQNNNVVDWFYYTAN